MLIKYLQKICSECLQSQTTNSIYFKIGEVKVRVSDHYSRNTDAKIQIIKSTNDCLVYTIFLGDSGKIYNYRLKEIKENLKGLITAMNLLTPAPRRVIIDKPKTNSLWTGPDRGVLDGILGSLKFNKYKGDSMRVAMAFEKIGYDLEKAKEYLSKVTTRDINILVKDIHSIK